MTPFLAPFFVVAAVFQLTPAHAQVSRDQVKAVAEQAIREHLPKELRLQALRSQIAEGGHLNREEVLELSRAGALTSDEISELRFGVRYGFQRDAEVNKELMRLGFQRSFDQERERWLNLYAEPRPLGQDPKLRAEVYAFIGANFEAIEVIIGAASGGNPYLRNRKRAEIEAFLYLLAEKGHLDTLGPDLLSTTLFLMFDLTYESNPFADSVINLGNTKDDLIVRVGFVHFLGALFYDWMDRALPSPLAKLARVVVTALEWIAVSQNNAFIKAAGLTPVGFKIYRHRMGSHSNLDLYAYPESTSDLWAGRLVMPNQVGFGLVFSTRFHTSR